MQTWNTMAITRILFLQVDGRNRLELRAKRACYVRDPRKSGTGSEELRGGQYEEVLIPLE